MARGWRTALAGLALAGFAGAAWAQEAGAADPGADPGAGGEVHGVLDPGAPEGAELTARTVRAFDRYALPVGRYGREAPNAREIEGRVIRSAWRLADTDATTADVMAGYAERLAALGYETLFRCRTDACGGFDFRFAVELVPPPAMLMDAADFAQLTALRPAAEGTVHVSVLVSRVLSAVYVQTVAVAPAQATIPVTAAPEPAAVVPAPGDAEALLELLIERGHLPLYSIAFEIGSAEITGASSATLDRVADALGMRPGLALLIVGHSDNQGGLEDNIALSRRRAEAVRAALVERGVAADRLEARGVGFLAPLATNATEEGRALNRRVELVVR